MFQCPGATCRRSQVRAISSKAPRNWRTGALRTWVSMTDQALEAGRMISRGGRHFRTLDRRHHGMGSIWPELPLSCSYFSHSQQSTDKIQSIWECDPSSRSPSFSAPHHTHESAVFLAVLICCLSLQTGLQKEARFPPCSVAGRQLTCTRMVKPFTRGEAASVALGGWAGPSPLVTQRESLTRAREAR